MTQALTLKTRKQFALLEKQVIVREFPQHAKVHVAVGDVVTPETILADYDTSGGFHLLHLGKRFGKGRELHKFLNKREGDRVYVGEIIAERSGFLPFRKTILKSPVDGSIASITPEGDMTIKLHGSRVSQASVFWGTVTAIDNFPNEAQAVNPKPNGPENLSHAPSISVETQYLNLYGIMGSGRKREGRVNVICQATDFMLPSNIDQSMENSLVICGALIERGLLAKALKLHVNGIICGGIHLRDATAMGMKTADSEQVGTDVGLSILITEGFGPISMNTNFYNIAEKFNNRYGMLDGNNGVLTIPLRPDEVKTLSGLGKTFPADSVTASVGHMVRIIEGDYTGKMGTIVKIPDEPLPLPSGFTTLLIEVALTNTQKEHVLVPWQNLEAIAEAGDGLAS